VQVRGVVSGGGVGAGGEVRGVRRRDGSGVGEGRGVRRRGAGWVRGGGVSRGDEGRGPRPKKTFVKCPRQTGAARATPSHLTRLDVSLFKTFI